MSTQIRLLLQEQSDLGIHYLHAPTFFNVLGHYSTNQMIDDNKPIISYLCLFICLHEVSIFVCIDALRHSQQ